MQPASKQAGAADAPPPDIQQQFRKLVRQWKKDTDHLSVVGRMVRHPAYLEIVSMGPPAVPLLLAELQRDPDFWFDALQRITKENPVPEQSAGKVKEMARAWIEWGIEKGYLHA